MWLLYSLSKFKIMKIKIKNKIKEKWENKNKIGIK